MFKELCVLQDSCEAAGDAVLDLVDYCHRKLCLLASGATTEGQHKLTGKAGVSSIEVRKSDVYGLGVYCSGILREVFLLPTLISHIIVFS